MLILTRIIIGIIRAGDDITAPVHAVAKNKARAEVTALWAMRIQRKKYITGSAYRTHKN